MYMRQSRYNNEKQQWRTDPFNYTMLGEVIEQYYSDVPTILSTIEVGRELELRKVSLGGYTLRVPTPYPNGDVPPCGSVAVEPGTPACLNSAYGLSNISSAQAKDVFRQLSAEFWSSSEYKTKGNEDGLAWLSPDTNVVMIELLLLEAIRLMLRPLQARRSCGTSWESPPLGRRGPGYITTRDLSKYSCAASSRGLGMATVLSGLQDTSRRE